MGHTLFIADLHLDEQHCETNAIFFNFMQQQAPLADALYILGDFFDRWIGDDETSVFNQKVKNCLKVLSKQIPIFFLHGNRDFLIGKKFAQETGTRLLPDFFTLKLYGQNTVLLHGDALCSLDSKHMKFRKLTQNIFVRALFLSLPLTIRKKIGASIRKSSRQHHRHTPSDTLGIVPMTVFHVFEKYQVTHMIHGHIHQPGSFDFLCNNQLSQRIVLGSWEQQGCALKWFANGKKEMVFFKGL